MLARLLILLICVAVGASASLYDTQNWSTKVRIQHLNDFLVDGLPGSDDDEANVQFAAKAVEADQSLDPLVKALAVVAKAQGCPIDVLSALGIFNSLDSFRLRRIERVFIHYSSKISTEDCFDTLEKEFHNRMAEFKDDSQVIALVRRFKETRNKYFIFDGEQAFNMYIDYQSPENMEAGGLRVMKKDISLDVQKLAGNDPAAIIYEKVVDEKIGERVNKFYPENYRYAFEKYLKEPCQRYVERVEGMFEGFYAVSKFLTNPVRYKKFKKRGERYWSFSIKRGFTTYIMPGIPSSFLSDDVRNGLWVYKRCRLIENYDEETVNDSFNTANLRWD